MGLPGSFDISRPDTEPIKDKTRSPTRTRRSFDLPYKLARVTALDPYLVTYLDSGTEAQPPI